MFNEANAVENFIRDPLAGKPRQTCDLAPHRDAARRSGGGGGARRAGRGAAGGGAPGGCGAGRGCMGPLPLAPLRAGEGGGAWGWEGMGGVR